MKDDLLIKYFLGEATAEESARIDAWLAESENNRREFKQLETVWEYTGKLKGKSPVTEDEAWARFVNKRDKPGHIQAEPVKITRFTPWLRIAAAIVILVAGTWSVWRFVSPAGKITEIEAGAVVKNVELPDGSLITMNAGSSIRYAGDFARNRNIELRGEAFFDVKHQAESAFSVTSGNVIVRVLGTAFNIRQGADQTEVVVARGLVQVSRGNEAVKLARQERIVVTENKRSLDVEENHDLLYRFYADKMIVADNTPLPELVQALNSAFDAGIKIDNARLKAMRLTVTFKNENLDGVLRILQMTEPTLVIDRRDGVIHLR
ncbi:FecR domain-containing protein [Pedobacter sp. SYP-B3415]|uniref:FecR domain-containing protein n=1 Tax=Pedobacter sp. SYP-B3415 TaxID=2496641 RepID=UPI00101E06F6|nr:FecR domain-containing protein [Pedobacter sp. SYP-B3415]